MNSNQINTTKQVSKNFLSQIRSLKGKEEKGKRNKEKGK